MQATAQATCAAPAGRRPSRTPRRARSASPGRWRDEHDGAARHRPQDRRRHLVRRRAVQVRGGLVGEQHGAVGEQRPGQRDPLPLAAGHGQTVLADPGREPVRQRAPARRPRRPPRARPPPPRRWRRALPAGRSRPRLESNRYARWSHQREQRARLVRVHRGEVDAVDGDRPGRRGEEAEQHGEQGRLARNPRARGRRSAPPAASSRSIVVQRVRAPAPGQRAPTPCSRTVGAAPPGAARDAAPGRRAAARSPARCPARRTAGAPPRDDRRSVDAATPTAWTVSVSARGVSTITASSTGFRSCSTTAGTPAQAASHTARPIASTASPAATPAARAVPAAHPGGARLDPVELGEPGRRRRRARRVPAPRRSSR